MKHEFCAVMPAETAPEGPDLSVVRAGPLAAVFAAAGGRGLAAMLAGRRAGRARGTALVARQRLLERLHASGDVLPAAPGARLTPKAAPAFLIAQAALLGHGLDLVAGRAQRQIVIGWDADAALDRFADAAELADCGGDPDALARCLGDRMAAQLARASADAIRLPVAGRGMLANLVCLGPRDGPAALDATLAEVDALWTEGLRIRVIGPSPAISFAAVAVTQPDARDVARASAALALAPDGRAPAVAEVEAAFRAAARRAHPDAGGDGDLDALRAARDLLSHLALARVALRDAGAPDGPAPPLARLLRDGGPALEAAPAAEVAA